MLYLFDKLGKRIGYIKTSQISFCFDNLGRQIGKICKSGNSLYLYNNRNKLLARFDGRNTYNANDNFICNGNYLYNILYPTLAQIR